MTLKNKSPSDLKAMARRAYYDAAPGEAQRLMTMAQTMEDQMFLDPKRIKLVTIRSLAQCKRYNPKAAVPETAKTYKGVKA